MNFRPLRFPKPQGSLHSKIALYSEVAHFAVQVWKPGSREGGKPYALTPQPERMADQRDGFYTLSIASLDPAVSWLAVIVTRLDADERADPVWTYSIVLRIP